MKRLIGFLLLASVTAPASTADSWPGPRVTNVFSDNGARFVRILPGESIGDAEGFRGARKGRYARGEFYVRQEDRSYKLVAEVTLRNPVAPVEALMSNAGYLLTFDNWHNFGYGKAVVVYGPDGKVLRAYEVEELYPAGRVKAIPRSVSSRWWRCAPHGYVDPERQTRVYVFELFGGIFTFDLTTGDFEYQPGRAKCQPPRGPFSATWFGDAG